MDGSPEDIIFSRDEDQFAQMSPLNDFLDIENIEISDEQGLSINMAAAQQEMLLLADPDGPVVQKRNWDVYASPLGKVNLTKAEAAFYDRLNTLCQRYLEDAALDGIWHESTGMYMTSGVEFKDLGLTSTQALNVACWFTYNCPQYYFVNVRICSDSTMVYLPIYDFAADGRTRAEITNELFDKLDGWIDSVDSIAATTYQKELYSNNLLCENVTYDYDCLAEEQIEKLWLNQSLYTAVIPENTVCAGYSKVFTAMMNAMDVETTAGLSVGHAWNVVHFDDGNYYAVDVCWNAGESDNTKYLNVGDATSKAGDNGKESHTYKSELVSWIPAIAQTDYAPTDHDISAAKIYLNAPENIQITQSETDASAYFYSWNQIENADEYQFAVFKDDSYQEILSDWTNAAWSGRGLSLKPDRVYYFGVRAVKYADGTNYYSDWSCFSQQTPADFSGSSGNGIRLDAPGNIRIRQDEEDANICYFYWDMVEGADLYQFALFTDGEYKEIRENSQGKQLWNRTLANFGLTNLNSDMVYYCGIRAAVAVDDGYVYSDWTCFQLDTGAERPDESSADPDVLAAPDGVIPLPIGNGIIIWNPVDGATGYEICLFTDRTQSEIQEIHAISIATYVWETDLAHNDKSDYIGIRAVKTVNGEDIYSEWTYCTI